MQSSWIWAAFFLEIICGLEQEWLVSTGIPVSLDVVGSNLTSSRIKVVSENSNCEDGWAGSVLVGCSSSCVQASLDATVALHPIAHNTVGCWNHSFGCYNVSIIALRWVTSARMEVEFDGVPHLRQGDRIMLGSEVACEANCDQDQLAALRGNVSTGHEVMLTADTRRFDLRIQALAREGSLPTFRASGLSWVCTNRVQTVEELYSASPQVGLQVCLMDAEGVLSRVGNLTFEAPMGQIPVAWLSPTSTALEAASPLVVTFKLPMLPAEAANESLRLQLQFNLSNLEPLQVDGSPSRSDGQPSAALCGRLFRELWANGSGFPQPRHCGYSSSDANVSLVLELSFDNLLEGDVIYQIVFLAVAKTTLVSPLQLLLLGTKPYFVYALGVPELTQPFQSGAGPLDPHLAAVQVSGGSNGVLHIAEGQPLELLIAGDAARPIHGGAQFRLFLSPLTAWATSGDGTEGCSTTYTKDLNISSPGLCQVGSVVPSLGFRNMLTLPWPLEIGEISDVYRLGISIGLQMPSGAFFAERLVAEISLPDYSKPHVVESSLNLLSWLPNASAILQISSHQMTGDLAPFSGASNQLFLQLTLRTTLRSQVEDSDPTGAASFSLVAPLGYSLVQVEPTGVLENSRWSCTGRTCTYTLRPFAAIWASSGVSIALKVINPPWPLRRCDPRNVWQISLQASGFHSTNLRVPASNSSFWKDDASACDSMQGVSVIGRLSPAYIHPTGLAVSSPDGVLAANLLQVFFTVEQNVNPFGRLRMEAHDDFTFQAPSCSDLPQKYYAADGSGSKTWPLLLNGSCTMDGLSAVIPLVTSLLAGRNYGFQIEVLNPRHYDPSQQQSWVLSTVTESGEIIDQTSGILEPIGLYSQQMRAVSWDEDDGVGNALGIQVIDGFPFRASGQEARVMISPIRTAVQLSAALRITAPRGYEWVFTPEDIQSVAGNTEKLPGGTPSVSSSVLVWPHARYEANQTYSFSSGIRLPEAAPVMGAAFFVEFGYDQTSLAAGHRTLAGRADAPPIRGLRNTKVQYSSNLRSALTKLTLQVELVTPIPRGGALVVRSPSGFAFVTPCSPQAAQSDINDLLAHQPPSTASCSTRPFPEKSSRADGGSQQADLVLAAGLGGIPDGVYRFEVTATNADIVAEEKDDAGKNLRSSCMKSLQCWTFLTLVDLHGESFGELDARSFVQGYQLKEQMPKAMLLPEGGRRDRPFATNRLTFGFQLQKNITGAALQWGLLLRGPAGILLREDCFVTPAHLDPTLSNSWEGLPVSSCEAFGHEATLTITTSVKAETRYAFAVEVQQNPPSTPLQNWWYLEMEMEASSPLAGFDVQKIRVQAIAPLTLASGPVWPDSTANLVNLTFRVETDQALAGERPGLVITAPLNFALQYSDKVCPEFFQADNLNANLCAKDKCECHLQGSNGLAVSFIEKPLSKDLEYLLVLQGVGSTNDAASTTWTLESFGDSNFLEGLDIGEVVGPKFSVPLKKFSIQALDPGGKELVVPSQDVSAILDLVLEVELPHPVVAADTILIQLPESHELLNMDATCGQLLWWEGESMSAVELPGFVAATCGPQRVALTFVGGAEVILPDGQALALKFAARNPPRGYGSTFWHVSHSRSDQLLATGSFQNWKVFAVLTEVSVQLASMAFSPGPRQSAVDVAFISAGKAAQLRIRGSAGFDFSRASSNRGQVIRAAPDFLLDLAMEDAEIINITVLHILLPESGPAFLDLETSTGSGELVARKIHLPVSLPGVLSISDPILQNEYQANPSQYPLQSTWPARFGEHVSVELEVAFPTLVLPGDSLRLSGKPFQMQGSLEILASQGGDVVPTIVLNLVDGEVAVVLAAQGLEASIPHKIVATAMPPSMDFGGMVSWSLQVVGRGNSPTSVGSRQARVHLVDQCKVEVTAQRSPPLATIEIDVLMQFGVSPHSLVLVAPLSFSFPEDCLATSLEANYTCRGAAINDQASAEVVGVQGLRNITLSVATPSTTPAARSWFLVALNQQGRTIAWCEDKVGISVFQMRSVAMIYPALPETSSELAVRFLLGEPLPPGGAIQLFSPPEIELNCSGEVQQMSVQIQGCTKEDGFMELILASELPAGMHSFALDIRTPSASPQRNTFSLFIRSPAGNMHEARTEVKGRELKAKALLEGRPLKHTAAEAGQASSIVVGFQVHEMVGKGVLGAVLITMAESFKHTLRFAEDLLILNPALPVAYSRRDGWAEVRNVDRILVFLDATRDIPPGAYDFRFPVTVPEELSAFNVWQITLCQPGFTSCSGTDSPDALLTFPTSGFGLRWPNRSTVWSVGFAQRPVITILSLVSIGMWQAVCT